MSVYFPNWLTSDVIIKSLLKDFKAHIYRNSKDVTAINFSFLPPEKFYMVPEEDIELFVEIYSVFTDWAAKELEIESIFLKYQFQPIEERTICSMTNDIQQRIIYYDNTHRVPMKSILAACLGIELSIFLPEELKNEMAMRFQK